MDYKEIPGFPRYGISTDGEIKNFETGRILKGCQEKSGYFLAALKGPDDKFKYFRIHQLVAMTYLGHVPCGHKIIVDHQKNEHRFDNSLKNLQLITHRQNLNKDRKQRTSKHSKYPGVSWHSQNKKWRAQISINSKRKRLGLFNTEEEAHQAYLKALNGID